MIYATEFALKDRVRIDHVDESPIEGVVSRIEVHEHGNSFEVCWWNERRMESAWFAPSRLTHVP